MEGTQKKTETRRKSHILRNLCIVIGLMLLSVGVLFLMLTHRPSVYQPTAPHDDGRVSPYLTHKLAPDMYNNIQIDKPFRVIVEQDGLNDIIVNDTSLGWEWPVQLDGVTISAPYIAFLADEIFFMGTVNLGKLPLVITIKLAPKLDEQGMLQANLTSVKVGAVNITKLAKTVISKVIAAQLEGIEKCDFNAWLFELNDAILENKPMKPVFPVYEKYIRLTDSEIQNRKLTLVFEPYYPEQQD